MRHTSSGRVLPSAVSFECDCDVKEPVSEVRSVEKACIGMLAAALYGGGERERRHASKVSARVGRETHGEAAVEGRKVKVLVDG